MHGGLRPGRRYLSWVSREIKRHASMGLALGPFYQAAHRCAAGKGLLQAPSVCHAQVLPALMGFDPVRHRAAQCSPKVRLSG